MSTLSRSQPRAALLFLIAAADIFRGTMRWAALIWIVLTTLAGGCTKFDAGNALSPGNGYISALHQPYATLPRQKLDAYRPKHAAAPAPVVVFSYGGGRETGVTPP